MIYTIEKLLPVFEENIYSFSALTHEDKVAFIKKWGNRAEAYVDRMSFYRLREVCVEHAEDVMRVICLVSELLEKNEAGGNVTGETTDGYSVTYEGSYSKHIKAEIRAICLDFLGYTGIFDRVIGTVI